MSTPTLPRWLLMAHGHMDSERREGSSFHQNGGKNRTHTQTKPYGRTYKTRALKYIAHLLPLVSKAMCKSYLEWKPTES